MIFTNYDGRKYFLKIYPARGRLPVCFASCGDSHLVGAEQLDAAPGGVRQYRRCCAENSVYYHPADVFAWASDVTLAANFLWGNLPDYSTSIASHCGALRHRDCRRCLFRCTPAVHVGFHYKRFFAAKFFCATPDPLAFPFIAPRDLNVTSAIGYKQGIVAFLRSITFGLPRGLFFYITLKFSSALSGKHGFASLGQNLLSRSTSSTPGGLPCA